MACSKKSGQIMSSVKPFCREFEVRASEVDYLGKLRLDALFALMQEMAWKNAQMLGFGRQIEKEGLIWVLSALELKVLKMPQWGEQISLSTWPKGVERLFARRDFTLESASGETLALATSAWLLLDAQSKRPKAVEKTLKNFPYEFEREALPGTASKVAAPATPRRFYHVEAEYADLDTNRHVNNANAVRILSNAINRHQPALLHPPFIFSIQYLSEIPFADQLIISKEELEDATLFEASGHDRIFFRAKMVTNTFNSVKNP
jgi:medium-chain acyl-[acyl-carrier-protein] hydrolase